MPIAKFFEKEEGKIKLLNIRVLKHHGFTKLFVKFSFCE